MLEPIYGKRRRQHGMTLVGLICILAIAGLVLVVAAKVSPTVMEYVAIKKAIETARTSGNSVTEIQSAFDRQATVGYIESISGKDLDVVKTGSGYDVSFAYPKKIDLVGPVSLLIEYQGTTARALKTRTID